MMGSVLDVRRCTQSESNSIFKPSSVLIGLFLYFFLIFSKMDLHIKPIFKLNFILGNKIIGIIASETI